MAVLLILIVFAIGAALFATQNTIQTSITFGQYTFQNLPVYLITLGALLVGIFVSAIVYLINSIMAGFSMRGTNGTLSSANKEIAELNKEIHQLELENTRLKTQLGEIDDDDNSL